MQLPPDDLFHSDLFRSTTARYLLEHKELPAAFYNLDAPEMREKFITQLETNGVAIVTIMYVFLKKRFDQDSELKQVSYGPQDFNVLCLSSEEARAPFGCKLCVITPPRPERPTLCERIFLLYSDDLERQGYFTVERAQVLQQGDQPYLLCGWNPYGAHFNCGVGFYEQNAADGECDPEFLVAQDDPYALVNTLPNRIKAELAAVYRYFAGLERPQLSINPARMRKLVEEWKEAHPGQELDDERELAKLMLRSVREGDD